MLFDVVFFGLPAALMVCLAAHAIRGDDAVAVEAADVVAGDADGVAGVVGEAGHADGLPAGRAYVG